MAVLQYEIRSGAYYDSVVLMQLQRGLAALEGVEDAGIVMATPANLDLLANSNLLLEEARSAQADDLLIVVRAQDEATATHAIQHVDTLVKERRQQSQTQGFRPRSLANAGKMLPQADWVLISVPGQYAAGVAEEALHMGKHVFLYSDNVSLADEVKLKQLASQQGLLLMGPDCGTAIINSVGLGFANRVQRGNIGIVAASGTGLQAIASRIEGLGAGISQAIGTGGRDLSEQVGGRTAMQALRLLDADPQTQVIVFVSKPPAPSVANKLFALVRQLNKPVILYFMGVAPPIRQWEQVTFALNLDDAAAYAVDYAPLDRELRIKSEVAPATGMVRGLFSGGTLAYETVLALQWAVFPLYTNTPLHDHQRLTTPHQSQAHTIVDLGADEYTQGRLHPMMDNELRLRRLQQEANDPDTGLILLDVVLGEGSHPDPASELAPAIAGIKARRDLDIYIILVGTQADPQDYEKQRTNLQEAGATLFTSVTEAVKAIATRFGTEMVNTDPLVDPAVLGKPLAGINVGVESFYDSLVGQGAEAVHVEWRPPAAGNEKLMALLAKMKQRKQTP